MRLMLAMAMVGLLVVFLYQPANHSERRFLETLQADHSSNVAAWGAERADRILRRTGDLRAEASAYPFPGEARAAAAPLSQSPATAPLEGALMRLANNEYVRAMDVMFSLVLYRLSGLIEIFPLFLPFLLLACVDGLIERTVRTREFRSHNPTIFGLFKFAAVVLLAALPIVFSLPYPFHPFLLAAVPIALAFCIWRIAAHFHQTV